MKDNLERWMTEWVKRAQMVQPLPPAEPSLKVPAATGQQIVNMQVALGDYSQKRAETNEGLNLQSCLCTPLIGKGDAVEEPKLIEDAANGNAQPRSDLLVVRESPMYRQGTFAGIDADGRASKVVEVVAYPNSSDETHHQIGVSIVGGRSDDVKLWAITSWLQENDTNEWLDNVEQFHGYR